MKKIILEVPDDVNIVCTNFICTQLFNTWVLNSSFQPKDGLKVIVHDAPDENHAVIAEPELSSPTYNLRNMFVACMGWDYEQGQWYKVSEVLPKIQHGIKELEYYAVKYKKYNAPNGWGTVESALEALKSLEECIRDNSAEASSTWNEIPLEFMYMRW